MRPRGTVAQRLRTAFGLYETAEAMARQRLRRENPGANAARIESLLQAWRRNRPGAELGDGEGRPRPWPPRR